MTWTFHSRFMSNEQALLSVDETTSSQVDRQKDGGDRVVDLILIAACFLLSVLVTNPTGDFPLEDDWSYGRTVRDLLAGVGYHPLAFTPAPMLTNVLWGSLFCAIFGFSFSVLRMSTLVAAVLGLSGVYLLAREYGAPRWLSLLAVAIVGGDPLFYFLSYTFDTDVLFSTVVIWSGYFYSRALTNGSTRDMVVGTGLAIIATLSRELAFCVPIAFAVTCLIRGPRSKRNLAYLSLPFLACFVTFISFRLWLFNTGRTVSLSDEKTKELLGAFLNIKNLVILSLGNLYVILLYCGLFLVAALLVTLNTYPPSTSIPLLSLKNFIPYKWFGAVVLLLGGLGAGLRWHYGTNFGAPGPLMPITGDYISKAGLDPFALKDFFLHPLPPLHPIFWDIVTFVGWIGAVLLAYRLVSGLTMLGASTRSANTVSDRQPLMAPFFLFTCGIVYLVPLLLATYLDDRYLMPSVPFLVTGIVCAWRSGPKTLKTPGVLLRGIAFITTMAMSVYSIATTHDYLAFNRVRWQALTDLMSTQHVGPEDIDGGWEFNGLYLYDPTYKFDTPNPMHPENWRGMWVIRSTFVIARGPLEGYSVAKEYSYDHWLPYYRQNVVVLRKQ